jgi:triacylglycerol lipase
MTFPIPWELFQPNWHARHDTRDALALALLCQLTYAGTTRRPRDPVRAHAGDMQVRRQLVQAHDWFPDGYEEVYVRKGGDIDTLAVLGRRDGVLVVAFRGSVSLADWVANVQAVRDPGPLHATKVHEGFQDAVYAAVMKLTLRIIDMRRDDEEIWLTGHSLGGAQAVLLAGMLFENGVPVNGLYTFAAPRAGNKAFEAALEAAFAAREAQLGVSVPHYRYVNEHDLVPHVPPEPLFSHAGEVRVLRHSRDRVSSGRAGANLWQRIRKSFIEWYDEITDDDLQVKAIHILADDEGYLPGLLHAAGYARRGQQWIPSR